MTDLLIASLILLVISAAAFYLAWRVGRLPKRWPEIVLGAGAVALTVSYLLLLRDSIGLVWLMPVSAVPVAGDPLPVFAALFAGLLAGQAKIPRWRRAVFAIVVVAAGWYGPVSAMTNRPPKTFVSWEAGVCLQSTTSTCGPAAATTLLHYAGVETTEAELARLCLTTDHGTHLTGLYRGLSLLAPPDTHVRVRHMSVAELMAGQDLLPVIASLRLTAELAQRDPRFVTEWGWDVGVTHTVVIFNFPQKDKVRLGDPGVGMETWRVRGLKELWTGEVIYLEADD